MRGLTGEPWWCATNDAMAGGEQEQEKGGDEEPMKTRGEEAWRKWWEAGEKAAGRVEAMSSVWWVIEWLPKVRARNKCTVDFPPSPHPFQSSPAPPV